MATEEERRKKGVQFKGYQAAQNQLLAIKAQQKANLQAAKMGNQVSAARTQVAAQAAGLVQSNQTAMNSVIAANMNQPTRNMLKKYGVGKPQTTTTSKQQGQNIIVNNTTNNYGGPVQGRALNFSDPQILMKKQTEETGRFKAWLSGLFNKQKEEDEARQRSYVKRDRELNKESNKFTKKLSEIGSNIAEGLSPKRIFANMNGGLKRILMFFGFHLLARNWTKILDGVASLEKRVRSFFSYLGFGKDGEEPSSSSGTTPFLEDMKKFLLGKDHEKAKSFLDALRMVFIDGDKSILASVKKWFELQKEERITAVKAVKFPELNESDLNNVPTLLRKGISYFGQLLNAVVNGSSALKDITAHNVESTAFHNSQSYRDLMEEDNYMANAKDVYGRKIQYTTSDGKKRDVDASAMAVMNGSFQGVSTSSIDLVTGNLKNNSQATIEQGAELNRLLNDASTGSINTAGVATAFDRLQSVTTSDQKFTSLPGYVLDTVFQDPAQKAQFLRSNSQNARLVEYKYIAVPKEEQDYIGEGASASYAYMNNYALNEAAGANVNFWKEMLDPLGIAALLNMGVENVKSIYQFFAAILRAVFGKGEEKIDSGKTKNQGWIKKMTERLTSAFEKALKNNKAIQKLGKTIAGKLLKCLGTIVGKFIGFFTKTIPGIGQVWAVVDVLVTYFKYTAIGGAFFAFMKKHTIANNYRLKLVPLDYQCQGDEHEAPEAGHATVLEVNKSGLKALNTAVTGSHTGTGHMGDESYMAQIQSNLESRASRFNIGKEGMTYDMNIDKAFEDYNMAVSKINDAKAEYNSPENSTYVSEIASDFSGRWNQSFGKNENEVDQTSYKVKSLTDGLTRTVVKRDERHNVLNVDAANRFANENFFTAEQLKNGRGKRSHPHKSYPDSVMAPGASFAVGKCARGVKDTLKAGGLVGGTDFIDGHANAFGDNLSKCGWIMIHQGDPTGYAEAGDVYYITPYTGTGRKQHKYGHVSYWDGTQWISDYKQFGYKLLDTSPSIIQSHLYLFRYCNKSSANIKFSYISTKDGESFTLENLEGTVEKAGIVAQNAMDIIGDMYNRGTKYLKEKTVEKGIEYDIFEKKNSLKMDSTIDLSNPILNDYEAYKRASNSELVKCGLRSGLTMDQWANQVTLIAKRNPKASVKFASAGKRFSSTQAWGNPSRSTASQDNAERTIDAINKNTEAINLQTAEAAKANEAIANNTGLTAHNTAGSGVPANTPKPSAASLAN